MNRVRYPAEFKAEAVKQVTERGHGVVDEPSDSACRTKACTCGCGLPKSNRAQGVQKQQLKAEVSWLKAELNRANEERDIIKKAATYFAKLSG